MNKIVQAFLVFFGVGLILLGAVFIIASGVEFTIIGAVLVLAAVLIFVFVYRVEKIEAAKPTLVSQNFNVNMEGSGKQQGLQMKCKSCGAPLDDKNLTVIQGVIMAKCPYCGATYAVEESPKW